MDDWRERMQSEVTTLKTDYQHLRNEQRSQAHAIQSLEVSHKLHDQEIKSLKEALTDIKSDTQWIRRKITGAIITAVVTAAIGKIITDAVSQLWGG